MLNYFNKQIGMNAKLQDFLIMENKFDEYYSNVSYGEMDLFVEKIKDKPCYMPGKEELLKKAEDFYFAPQN